MAKSRKPKAARAKSTGTQGTPERKPAETTKDAAVAIVGIGASAGGLEALEEFFTNMPPDSGLAFVVVQHLDPSHKSILADLVKRFTRMRVFQVTDGMAVEPNCVYVIPPNRDLTVMAGVLQLLEPVSPRGLRMPIDMFLRSLASDLAERAVCIVLSGTGTEGTLGLKAVKGEGGLVMVQDPATAKYDGMPRSAEATGLADFVLPPEQMPQQLLQVIRHGRRREAAGEATGPAVTAAAVHLQKVFVLLRSRTGHDFSLYKQNTILRRLERRMAVNQIEQVVDYVRFMREHPEEIDTLFKDLLIEVTSFFRDPEAFEALQQKVVPALCAERPADVPVRVWVPGCSTGEEAYSIAMLLVEHLDELKSGVKAQIFATDINPEAIEVARRGIYPAGIASDITPERLRRFFTKDKSTYRVKQNLRDLLVFSEQSVTRDPPFSKLDLVSCRNLLIYMGPEIQKRLLPLFHYALNRGGYLFLGTSETVGSFTDQFSTVDRKWKLFRREGRVLARGATAPAPPLATRPRPAVAPGDDPDPASEKIGFKELTEKLLLREFSPAAVVVNESCDIHYVHGRTGRFLEPAEGSATLNLLAMAREGLRLELSTAVRKVLADGVVVCKEGLRVRDNGNFQVIDLTVQPIVEPPAMQGLMLVVFESVQTLEEPKDGRKGKAAARKGKRVVELEQELAATKEYLQTTIEELETSNEEMKSTNEELQSSNEELQSTNEELETSKEELQSVNEELTTVNTELESKIEELSRANDDLNNLLTSTDIGTVFLDTDLRIKRFTPTVTKVMHLIATDIDRPLAHVATQLEAADLVANAREVLRTLAGYEGEAYAADGCWYSLRILPYRTTRNVIEGVVITLVDITASKQQQAQLEQSRQTARRERDLAEAIVRTIREPLLVLDDQLRVTMASEAFYATFGLQAEETLGAFVYDLGSGAWDIPELRRLLEEVLPRDSSFEGFEMDRELPGSGRARVVLKGRRLQQDAAAAGLILLTMETTPATG